MSRTKRPLQRRLRFEGLESRRLLTGNVAAKVTNFNLFLNGDTQDNAITVRGMGANTYCISGQNGTTINGQSKLTVTGVTNNVYVNFLNGDDTLVLTDAFFPADVNVKLGNGEDLVQVGFSSNREFGTGSVDVHRNLNITLGNGAFDEVDQSDLFVGHDNNIKLGDGHNDEVFLGESGSFLQFTSQFAVQVAHDFNITLGNGSNDLVNLADVQINCLATGTSPVVSTGALVADQSPSGGESVDVGHDFNITFGKGNGDAVTIDAALQTSSTEGPVSNNVSLVTVGHDFRTVMGNGNDDNVTINISETTVGGTNDVVTPADGVSESTIVDGSVLAVGHDLSVTLGNGNFDSVSPSGSVARWETSVPYNAQPFVTVGHDANITLGSGQGDTVGATPGPMIVTAGLKNESFTQADYFAVVVNHDFNVRLGLGAGDDVELIDLLVGHNLSITEGNGASDNVFLANASIGANLAVTTGNGGDDVSLNYVEAFQANITTGSGDDSVSINNSSDFAKLYVFEGAGDDELFVESSTYVSQIAYFDGGPGSNFFDGTGPFGPATVTKVHF